MDQTRWQQIEELLQQALDLERSERIAFLATACDGDPDLRREVQNLLNNEGRAFSLIERPAAFYIATPIAQRRALVIGESIRHYQIESLIGSGGMGEVWRAIDQRLKRTVAFKILPREFSSDSERVRRFEREAYAVSALKHPNIITIHEIGQADDLHFIVTELVEGNTLRDRLDHARLGWREAVRVATQIVSALHAAHTAGIIHRDIKPENVIVQPGGQVKLLDFGIAKWVGVEAASDASDSLHTGAQTKMGVTPGTLKYMSPEQARGENLDSRTDIFSLGLVLYEMIVGRHPFDDSSEDVTVALKSDAEISSPSGDGQIIPSALSHILQRALRKNRNERYASAAEMLGDLDELKSLVDVSRQEKGQKLFRARNANQLLTQFAVLYDADPTTRMPLAALWPIWRFADLNRGQLERALIRKSLISGLAKIALLTLAIAAVTTIAAAVMSVSEVWEERVMRDGHVAAVRVAVFSPDGRLLVSVGEDAKVIVWDFARRERIKVLSDHSDWVHAVAFSPDGKWFATASDDKTAIVWDAARLEKVAVLGGHSAGVYAVAFSADGRTLASASAAPSTSGATVLWEVAGWEKIREFPMGRINVGDLHFSPDSRWLINSHGQTLDVPAGLVTENADLYGTFSAVSPDFKRRVTTDGDGDVKFFGLSNPREDNRWKLLRHFPRAHGFHGRMAVFSPDGKLAATSADDIILWDVEMQSKITRWQPAAEVWGLAFSPDGRWLVSTHADGAILVWDVVEREAAANFNEHYGSVRAVAFSPDGKHLASASEDRSVILWNSDTGLKEAVFLGHKTRVTAVRFSPDGQQLASCDQSGSLKLWALATRQLEVTFQAPHTSRCYDLAISPDGRFVAITDVVFDVADGRQLMGSHNPLSYFPPAYGIDFSNDGRWLAGATELGRIVLIDTKRWKIIDSAQSGDSRFTTMRLSADARWLVTGDIEGTVKLWQTSPLRQAAAIGRHRARVKSVAFSPDGREIASSSEDQTIALWDVSRRKAISFIGTHATPVLRVAFSPDGQRLISGEDDNSVRLYARYKTLWGYRLN